MRVIIAGSRNIKNKALVYQVIAESKFEITEVVTGCAQGVDGTGEQYAIEQDIPIKEFRANWELHMRAASFIRNREMAKYSDALIAVWDGKSKGTKNMIEVAREYGLKVFVHILE